MHWVYNGESAWGLLAAAGLCGALGAALALPALRLRNIYLALATLSFAVLMDNTFFGASSIVGSSGIIFVGRPDLFGYRFATMRSYLILLVVLFALAVVVAGAVRRGAFGRRLVALQDSPVASSTLGAGPVWTKLVIFSASAALAGVAGALWAGIGGEASAQQFEFLMSILIFVAVTLAGSRLLSSALLAGFGLSVVPELGTHLPSAVHSDFQYLLFGVGMISIGRNPNAIGRVYSDVGDWWRLRAHPRRVSTVPDGPTASVAGEAARGG
jgi:branched-chain amino acid transport system permease protein